MSDPLGPLIGYVCDAHVLADRIGPLVTRHDGAWSYCAGHGASDHRWRRVPAVPRDLLDKTGTKVSRICGDARHLEHGLNVPDGDGYLFVSEGEWAYCSAVLQEPHVWRAVKRTEFRELRHEALAGMI